MISKEERKKKLEHYSAGYLFKSCIDLSEGVYIYPDSYTSDDSKLLAAVAEFVAWWMCNIHSELNGFSGMDTIKWTVILE